MSKAERMSINMINITCPIVDEFAEKRIEEVSNEIRNKHFNLLEKSSLEMVS